MSSLETYSGLKTHRKEKRVFHEKITQHKLSANAINNIEYEKAKLYPFRGYNLTRENENITKNDTKNKSKKVK